MLVHEPEGITIGVPGSHDSRNRRASCLASLRNPSLKAACPQQNARGIVRTFTCNRSSTAAAASRASGKNSSARQVGNSTTSFIRRPDYRAAKHFGTMHTHHDALLDVG